MLTMHVFACAKAVLDPLSNNDVPEDQRIAMDLAAMAKSSQSKGKDITFHVCACIARIQYRKHLL